MQCYAMQPKEYACLASLSNFINMLCYQGGPDAEQEMCEAVQFYYPKSHLTDCRSQPEFYSFFKVIGIENVTGGILSKMGLPWTKEPIEK